MPKRPLSAYNIFFREERRKLLGEDLAEKYEIEDQSTRKHRKSHGKIPFREMATMIAANWKNLGTEDKEPFEKEAAVEREKYARALAIWKAEQAQKDDAEQQLGTTSEHTHDTSGGHSSSSGLQDTSEDSARVAVPPGASAGVATSAFAVPSASLLPPSASAAAASLPAAHSRQESSVGTIMEPAFAPATNILGGNSMGRNFLDFSMRSFSLPPVDGPASSAAFWNTSLRGIPVHADLPAGPYSMGINSQPGDAQRRARLEELYRMRISEAAAIQQEMQRGDPLFGNLNFDELRASLRGSGRGGGPDPLSLSLGGSTRSFAADFLGGSVGSRRDPVTYPMGANPGNAQNAPDALALEQLRQASRADQETAHRSLPQSRRTALPPRRQGASDPFSVLGDVSEAQRQVEALSMQQRMRELRQQEEYTRQLMMQQQQAMMQLHHIRQGGAAPLAASPPGAPPPAGDAPLGAGGQDQRKPPPPNRE